MRTRSKMMLSNRFVDSIMDYRGKNLMPLKSDGDSVLRWLMTDLVSAQCSDFSSGLLSSPIFLAIDWPQFIFRVDTQQVLY